MSHAPLSLFALLALLISTIDARIISSPHARAPKSAAHSFSASAAAPPQYCPIPVAKQAVTFPASIAGRAPTLAPMWSGYVNITADDYLFYWLFETRDSDPQAPLVIWTNGGPGCSAMEGATTEIGPLSLFDIKEACQSPPACDFTQQLAPNAWAWNAHANVLVVDQPRTVGYSFGRGGSTVHSSVAAAEDFLVFVDGVVRLFPEFAGRALIIAGESYGGHYIPAFAGSILERNEAVAAGARTDVGMASSLAAYLYLVRD
jgi:carboxypeptidase C (cathepsin A)